MIRKSNEKYHRKGSQMHRKGNQRSPKGAAGGPQGAAGTALKLTFFLFFRSPAPRRPHDLHKPALGSQKLTKSIPNGLQNIKKHYPITLAQHMSIQYRVRTTQENSSTPTPGAFFKNWIGDIFPLILMALLAPSSCSASTKYKNSNTMTTHPAHFYWT